LSSGRSRRAAVGSETVRVRRRNTDRQAVTLRCASNDELPTCPEAR
jgi:hypothetical protein